VIRPSAPIATGMFSRGNVSEELDCGLRISRPVSETKLVVTTKKISKMNTMSINGVICISVCAVSALLERTDLNIFVVRAKSLVYHWATTQ
jgi:hypothetical protein